MGKQQFRDGNAVTKRGRRPLRASGAMTDAERAKRYRTPQAAVKERPPSRRGGLSASVRWRQRLPKPKSGSRQRRYSVILADPPWRFDPWDSETENRSVGGSIPPLGTT